MYHDEFAKRSARFERPASVAPSDNVAVPAFALEFGGGLSLGLAASLNPPISAMILGLGGLLPLVASSFAIALHRGSEFLGGLAPITRILGRSTLPVPHLSAIGSTPRTGPYYRQAQSARGRFEASRQGRPR